ncbi:hypothetical protein [Roseospirillum parvum]|uniref:Uncharacterized protein n=1 Tax=Roseospirillum parvum TaxID=83401 RepID=A0A1G7Y972_9PROT|nr:hypothetical protein [Roseospirillum parvum]SDG92914.1 hypothetical protein SAMN05421742_103229 [Roseospirillum parvum]
MTFKVLKRLAAALLLVGGLNSCYLPDDYLAEIRLNWSGGYGLIYKGILTWVPLYADIIDGKLSAAEASEKVAQIRDDLARDSHFKSIESLGRGQFRVYYEREGILGPSEQVSFVRRNALILSLISKEDGTLEVRANTIPAERLSDLDRLDLSTIGRFRVTTNAQVIKHNAPVAGPYPQGYPGFYVFDWHLTGNPALMDSPKLTAVRRPAKGLP